MGTCLKCSQPHISCTCNKTKSDNLSYTGPNLPCTGVDTNDDMTLVVQKLNDAICQIVPPTSTTTSTSSSTSTTTSSSSTTTSTSTSSSTTTTTTTILPFRSLTGYLNQTGTSDPTITIISNNLGGTIQTSYLGVGNVDFFFNSPTYPLLVGKTFVIVGSGLNPGFINAGINSPNLVFVSTKDITGLEADDILSGTPIQIIVYP